MTDLMISDHSKDASLTSLLEIYNPGESKNEKKVPRILFYGIGNIGRQDDGLGIRLIEALEVLPEKPINIDLQSNYQLNAEDALEVSEYDIVVFVDASLKNKSGGVFDVRPIQASSEISFSTHAMTMEGILALSDQLYSKKPKSYLLALPGHQWEINDILTPEATLRLEETLKIIKQWFLAFRNY